VAALKTTNDLTWHLAVFLAKSPGCYRPIRCQIAAVTRVAAMPKVTTRFTSSLGLANPGFAPRFKNRALERYNSVYFCTN